VADIVKFSGRENPQANIYQLVHDWLRDKKNGRWLLILDNLGRCQLPLRTSTASAWKQANDDRQAQRQPLATYIPHSPNGSIILTSRSKGVANKLVEEKNIFVVEPMDPTHATELLQKRLEKLGAQEDSPLAELASILECMPLAMVQLHTSRS
jgi:hypothetical protein